MRMNVRNAVLAVALLTVAFTPWPARLAASGAAAQTESAAVPTGPSSPVAIQPNVIELLVGNSATSPVTGSGAM